MEGHRAISYQKVPSGAGAQLISCVLRTMPDSRRPFMPSFFLCVCARFSFGFFFNRRDRVAPSFFPTRGNL